MAENDMTHIYALGVAVLLASLLLASSVYMSVNALNDAIAKKNFAVNVQGGTGTAGGSAAGAQNGGSQAAPSTGRVTDVGPAAGNYKETTEPACIENGKLIVRAYTTSWCPHCTWEKPVLQKALAPFGDKVDLRIMDVDTGGASAAEMELWKRYNPDGSIPTVVIGCKYYQVGSGETLGEQGEIDAIQDLACKALGESAPAGVCS